MRITFLVTSSILALLAGCATTSPSQHGLNLRNAGSFQAAYDVWKSCADQGDPYCINNIGTMYENGQMQGGQNLTVAVAYYNLAARYGLPIAQQNLMRLGQTVPSADLAAIAAQQQANQQAQQAQNNQWAAQLGSIIGCAAAGGNCAGSTPSPASAPRKQQAPQPAAIKICNSDYECGARGVCLRPNLTTQGVCGVR